MSTNSKIEWTDATWPVVSGCEKVSSGCANCYAVKEANRLAGNPHPNVGPLYTGLVERQSNGILNWTGVVRPLEQRLDWPRAQKKPLRIFVSSLGDLFHPSVPFDFLDRVIETMLNANQHTYQILTKQPARMLEYFNDLKGRFEGLPLRNVWLGVSVENQATADERIPLLLQIPAAVRFLSCEPLLGPVDLTNYIQLTDINVYDPNKGGWGYDEFNGGFVLDKEPFDIYNPQPGIHWVIAGGESGNKARPMHPYWVTSLRDQCIDAEVAFHFKQWGQWLPLPQIMEWSPRGWVAKPEWKEKVIGKDWGALTLNGVYSDQTTTWNGRQLDPEDNSECTVYKLGKKLAGRELDGRTWEEFPEVGE